MIPPCAHRWWTAAAFFLALAAPAWAQDYLERMRAAGYDSIFVVRVLSASTVTNSNNGRPCYFKYESVITRPVRGKPPPASFAFSAKLGLKVGDEYLVYFSDEFARKHRFSPNPEIQCEKDFAGFFLVFDELHAIENIWDGKRWMDVVVFDDALETVPAAREIDRTVRSADLDYVMSELRK